MTLLTPTTAPREQLRARLRQLERAARPLDPGASRRKALRGAVVAASERFLRSLGHAQGLRRDRGQRAWTARRAHLRARHPDRGGDRTARARRDPARRQPGLVGGTWPTSRAAASTMPRSATSWRQSPTSTRAIFFTGPGAVRMENMLLRWVADLVGYPAEAGGNIASGGSIASLTAIATARDAHGLKGADYASAVVYLTAQAHHCLEKALRLAGHGGDPRAPGPDGRPLPHAARGARGGHRRRPRPGAPALARHRGGGHDRYRRGGSARCHRDRRAARALLVPRGRGLRRVLPADARTAGELLRGIERSDSVVLDPHKGLFLPYGAGIVLVRDARPARGDARLRRALHAGRRCGSRARCRPPIVSPELSKHFRALRMWLPLVLLGTRPFRAALEEKLLLARYFHEEVEALGFEVGPPPDLSIATYRWAPPGVALEETNRLNQALVDGVAARRPGLHLLDHARRAVHAADGGARLPDPPTDDRSGAPGAAGAGGKATGKGGRRGPGGRPVAGLEMRLLGSAPAISAAGQAGSWCTLLLAEGIPAAGRSGARRWGYGGAAGGRRGPGFRVRRSDITPGARGARQISRR